MDPQPSYPTFAPGDHEAFMEYALEQAQKSPPAPNKFCVGAALVDGDSGEVLSIGYSIEFPRDYQGDPGTTHAEPSTTSQSSASGRFSRRTRCCTRPWSHATKGSVAT